MKKLLAAVLALSLAPAIALAQEGAPAAVAAEAAPLAAEPALAPTSATPTAPNAGLAATPESLAAEKATPGGFGVGVGIDNAMSHTVFHGVYDSPTVGSSVDLAPSYGFKVGAVRLVGSAKAAFSYEYTDVDQPPGAAGHHNGRKWDFEDVGLALSAPSIFKEEKFSGITVTPRIGLTVPASFVSRYRGTITNLSGGVAFGRAFGNFTVGLNLGAGKTFFAEATRTITETEQLTRDEQNNILYICRKDVEFCGTRGVSAEYAVSAGGTGSYSITDKFAVSLGITLSKSVMPQMPANDGFTSQKMRDDGTFAAVRQGARDRMIGSLGVSYALTPIIGMSLSAQTVQTPLGYDAEGLQNPWFDVSGSGARTQYSLGLNASF